MRIAQKEYFMIGGTSFFGVLIVILQDTFPDAWQAEKNRQFFGQTN